MKFILLVLLVGLLGVRAEGQPPGMRASKHAVRNEVIALIEGQLAAFRAEDVPRAYSCATAMLRAQLPPQRFAQMVREGYPEIWFNTRAEYGIVWDDDLRANVTARVFVKDGMSAAYDYVLVKEEGAWRIASVLRREIKEGERI